jgi:hypothetical protein
MGMRFDGTGGSKQFCGPFIICLTYTIHHRVVCIVSDVLKWPKRIEFSFRFYPGNSCRMNSATISVSNPHLDSFVYATHNTTTRNTIPRTTPTLFPTSSLGETIQEVIPWRGLVSDGEDVYIHYEALPHPSTKLRVRYRSVYNL